jgi:hypothetical protein
MDLKSIGDLAKTFEIPTKDLAMNTLGKPTKELGEGVGNLFWLVFSPIHAARAALEPRIEKFRSDIETEVSRIPVEQVAEPPLNIVGPALEASKYHIEDEDVRSLFAKLIASSMNTVKQDKVHPAFVEVIKQLTPFDVKVLSFLHINRHTPVGDIILTINNRENKVLDTEIFPFPEMNKINVEDYSTAVKNINRLGLISIDYSRIYTDPGKYDILENHYLFSQYRDDITNTPNLLEQGMDVTLRKGSWTFTAFGERFTSCCF